jgi:hypothetical protein
LAVFPTRCLFSYRLKSNRMPLYRVIMVEKIISPEFDVGRAHYKNYIFALKVSVLNHVEQNFFDTSSTTYSPLLGLSTVAIVRIIGISLC